MLIRKDPEFNFHEAVWPRLEEKYPGYSKLLRSGMVDDASAATRYAQLMEDRPKVLACFFNLMTAMTQISLPEGTPADYLSEVDWDEMKQDRFFAWANPALIDQVVLAAAHGLFKPEPATSLFHPGASRSWKQVQFGEANVQLTFHESERKEIGGVNCVKIEPDIDYFRDPAAHAILEVAVNTLAHSATEPAEVYVLRWIAGRHAGVPAFEPPYTLE